ncbi:MAG: hypothetical protein ACE5HV_07020 [Acidobacteriota bacterium]
MVHSSAAHQAVWRAVGRVRAYGIDGPRPIEEIEAVLEYGAAVGPALCAAVEQAGGADLAACIHLVSLLRSSDALAAVRRAAFERPAPLEAKQQAVDALRACGEPAPSGEIERLRAAKRFIGTANAGGLREVLGWPSAWRLPVLVAWLRGAGPAELELVGSILGADPELDLQLLGWLGRQATREAAERLQQYIAAAPDRERLKHAKRALHQLKSRGIAVEQAVSEEGQSSFSLDLDTDPLHQARAYITSVDGRGSRLVWILWPSARAGSRLLQAVVSDVEGFQEAELVSVTRKGFRAYLERFSSRPTLLVARVEVTLAARRLAAAAERTMAGARKVPAAYEKWRHLASSAGFLDGDGSRPCPPRIYEWLDAEAVRGRSDLLEASVGLLQKPAFSSWAVAGESIDRAVEEVRNSETSALVIDDEQRRAQMQRAIRSAVDAVFTPDTRRCYRRRLEVMAGMLWDEDRPEAAEAALAAAVGFTDIDDLFTDHPFARALVHRGVWISYEERRRQDATEGRRSRVIQS